MGGGESGGQPYDELGGQYATFSGGTPSNFDYSALGSGISKGLGEFGSAIANQPVPNYMKGTAGYDTPNIPGAATQQQYVGTQTGSMIPGGGQSLDLEAILRLLKGLG